MRFGLILPNYRPGAGREGIEAAAQTAARLGWSSVWTTDHVLVDSSARALDYVHIFEAISTLAWLAGREETLKLGTSVIVVPMRNAVVLAKVLATIDQLSAGRLIVGTGVGWNEKEFANVGESGVFHRRGAYLDEAIAIWRHLWSGRTEPFRGRFHTFDDFHFSPLPAQGARLPIWVGGRSDAALQRAGSLGDGFHSSAIGPDVFAQAAGKVLEIARESDRPAPALSARVRVVFGDHRQPFYALHGTPEGMLADVDAFSAAGANELMVDFGETDPERHTQLFERFHREVAAARIG